MATPKNRLKSLSALLGYRLLHAVTRRRAPGPDATAIGLLCVSTHGSLGDEALLRGAIEGLRRRTRAPVVVLNNFGDPEWRHAALLKAYPDLHYIRLDQRRMGLAAMRQVLGLRSRLGALLIPGADVLDGAYNLDWSLFKIRLAALASRSGLRAGLLGFSYNEAPHPACSAALAQLDPAVFVSTRDAESQARVRRACGREPVLGADLAFMMQARKPEIRRTRLLEWVAERPTPGPLLGICPNSLFVRFGWDQDQIAAYFQRIIGLLRSRHEGLRVLLLPHDYRSFSKVGSDLDLCKKIHAVCAPEMGDALEILDEETDAPGIKWLCAHTDLVFTSRMHCAIAALGSGIPAASIAYQGKFEGLFRHFELPSLLITENDAKDASRTSHLLSGHLSQLPALKAQVQSRLPAVLALSEANLQPALQA